MRLKSSVKSFSRLLFFSVACAISLGGPLLAQGMTAVTAGPMAAQQEAYPPTYVAAPSGFGQQLATTTGTFNAVTISDAKARFAAGSSWTVEGRVTWDGSHGANLFSRGRTDYGDLGSILLFVDAGGYAHAVAVTTSGTKSVFDIPNQLTPRVPASLAVVYNGSSLTLYVNGHPNAVADTDAWDPGPGSVAGTYIGRGYSADPSNVYQGVSTANIDEVAISTVAQYSAAYTPATGPFPAGRKGQSALYHLDGNLSDANTNADFVTVGGGGPTGPLPPTLSAAWASALLPLWGNTYNALTDTRLPFLLVADGGAGTPTDNLAHLNADAAWISTHGGGVLYLPTGIYYCSTTTSTGIQPASNVIIEGDGYDVANDLDRTRLRFNASGTASARGVHFPSGATSTGFYNIALEYAGPMEGASPADATGLTTVGYTVTAAGPTSNVLLKNVRLHQGAGNYLALSHVANLAIEDSTIDDPGNYPPLYIDHAIGLTLTRLTASYKEGLFGTEFCPGMVLNGVSLFRRGGNPIVFQSGGAPGLHTVDGGGFECNGCTGALYDACSVATTGTRDLNNNDGECWASQAGGANLFSDRGTVGSYSNGVLTDTTKAWSQNWDPGSYLLFFSGPAAGKYLPVLSHTATTVTVAPFSPAPRPGDIYAVEVPNALHITVQNCVFNGNHALIVDDGAIGCTFAGNTFNSSAGMLFVAFNKVGLAEPLWFNTVTGNTIRDPDGQNYSFIGMFTSREPSSPSLPGQRRGNRIYGNTVSPPPPGVNVLVRPNYAGFGVVGPGVYQGQIGSPDPAANADAPFPGVTNGVGPIPAATAALDPTHLPVQPGAYNLGEMPATRAVASGIIQTYGQVVYKGRAYYNAADLPAEFN